MLPTTKKCKTLGQLFESLYHEDEYDRFTFLFYHVGDWEEAEKLLLVQVGWRTRMFGAETPKTLASINNLACTYMNQGKWDEAEKLFVDVMNARKAKLGSDPDTLTSMANLASTYSNQGRWDEAEKLEVDVMNASKAKLGSDHPDTLNSIGNLALTYSNQGRWDEAEKLQMGVMNARKTKLGSDHTHTHQHGQFGIYIQESGKVG